MVLGLGRRSQVEARMTRATGRGIHDVAMAAAVAITVVVAVILTGGRLQDRRAEVFRVVHRDGMRRWRRCRRTLLDLYADGARSWTMQEWVGEGG